MKKNHVFTIIIFTYVILTNNIIFSDIVLPDYNQNLKIPENQTVTLDLPIDNPTSFSFKIGKIDGDINLFGSWAIRLGYGAGFTLYPDETSWVLTAPGLKEGIIFEQNRLFSLDWITDSGIFFHLFFNDEPDDTEFVFKYDVGSFFKSLYITNKFNDLTINPYRSLSGGRAQDINFGFDWGNRIYRGRFDLQFDSVKNVVDRFKGGKKDVNVKILSNQYERGVYYYLPDKNISEVFEVYKSDSNGDYFGSSTSEDRYSLLTENTDYIVDINEGYIKFLESVYEETVLVYYKVNINGMIYEVGDVECGKNGINGKIDFNKNAFSSYFKEYDGTTYMILNFKDEFTYFEEKNSYRIANPNTKISDFNAFILDDTYVRQSGFKYWYDEDTGCLRVTKNDKKSNTYNIYPFYDYVDFEKFYGTFYSPGSIYAKNIIDYSCYIYNEDLKLSANPIESSIRVLYNSIPLDTSQYSYDYISQSISINFEVTGYDLIEVFYVTQEEEAYNLTGTLKNDFRLNDYLMIGDSLWYKMPIRLWEESYYFDKHNIELLYFGYLKGDFHELLVNKENSNLEFDVNAGFSMYYPELKGVTIIDDFEYELKGYKLSLHYNDWYPIDIPTNVYNADLGTASKGRLFFRNMHNLGIIEGSNFISFSDSGVPDYENYTDGARIGPYSSSDGFTYVTADDEFEDRENTLSLITEFKLDADEAISVIFPVSSLSENIDFSSFNGLNLAVKKEKLKGDLRIYIDAGAVGEIYDASDTTVQTELLDEGLKYKINDNGTYYMYKGKNDDIKKTNDFDGNGQLDNDDTTNISTFSLLNSTQKYAKINKKYNNINFIIDDPAKLRKFKGVRITLYSTTGARGTLIFNQIRFTESGWQYNTNGDSDAQEISPIEDDDLRDNIFSEENPDFDRNLHFQRYKERTLRVNLKQNESFYLEKKFTQPIDIGHFKKMNVFIFLSHRTKRELKLTLQDTYGNKMHETIDLDDLKSDKWHQLEYYFEKFSGFNNSNKLISEIRFDFENENSDTSDNVFYIDEICMQDPVPAFGFATNNSFLYSEPDLDFNIKDFSIFRSPYVNWKINYYTKNFLANELTPSYDYFLENEIISQFHLAGIDYYFSTLLNFIFRDSTTYNTKENLQVKISKNPGDNNPFMFKIQYDYSKYGLPDIDKRISSLNLTQQRSLLLETGIKIKNFFRLNFGYDISTNIKDKVISNTKLFAGYQINAANIYHNLYYSIKNSNKNENFYGSFSFDNLGYLISKDFITFGYNGERKEQSLEYNFGVYLAKPVYYSNRISVNQYSNISNTSGYYDFYTNFKNKYGLDFKAGYKDKQNNLVSLDFERDIQNNYNNYIQFEYITWSEHFKEFSYSINYIIPIIFYPPFSSIYKNNNEYLIDEELRFNMLNDKFKINVDWSIFLEEFYFAPNSFSFSFSESIINTIKYYPTYVFDMILIGSGRISSLLFRLFEFKYTIYETISITTSDNIYSTGTTLYFNFFTYKNFDIELALSYDQDLTYGNLNKKMQHTISISALFYKNFFKKNYISNDKYGVEMSYLGEISTKFHNRFDNREIDEIDNILTLRLTPKVGYRFNRNFTVNGILEAVYSADYNQEENTYVHRFGVEMIAEGLLTF